jgi:hypothetical protein
VRPVACLGYEPVRLCVVPSPRPDDPLASWSPQPDVWESRPTAEATSSSPLVQSPGELGDCAGQALDLTGQRGVLGPTDFDLRLEVFTARFRHA